MLRKTFFRTATPADIIAQVNQTTLAVISKWTPEQLEYFGWSFNPVIDILYSMTYPAGVWIARTDTNGQQLVRESLSSSIYNAATVQKRLTLNLAPSISGNENINASEIRKTVSIPFVTDGSGHVTVDLDTALAGFYGVVKLLYWSQHSATAKMWVLSFQDEDGTDCKGANAGIINITLPIDTNDTILGFGPAGVASHHPILYTAVDGKKLQCVIAGENTTAGTLVFEEWKET